LDEEEEKEDRESSVKGKEEEAKVIKDDEYYENLGDVLTKKYSLPVNSDIQIKIDKPDDEPDYVIKGKAGGLTKGIIE
jgi:hypothetical protein